MRVPAHAGTTVCLSTKCNYNSRVRTRLALISILVLGATSCVLGQSMEEENGNPNLFIRSIQRASEDFPGWFPQLSAAEPRGSLVVAGGDFHNADVHIIVEKGRLDELKPRVMALVAKLQLPLTFVRVRRGRVIGSFDLEFNAYIHYEGNHSFSKIPLGAIVEEVRGWSLPRPLGVVILGDQHWSMIYRGERVLTTKLLWPNDISSSDTVDVSVQRHWYGLVMLLLLGAIMIFAFGFLVWITVRPPKARAAAAGAKTVAKTLVETQAQYDAAKSKKPVSVVLGLSLGFFTASVLLPSAMEDAEHWFPADLGRVMPVVIFGMSILVVVRIFTTRMRKAATAKKKPEGVLRYLPYMMIPVVVLLAVLQIQAFAPNWLYGIPAPVLSWFVRIVGFSPLVGLVIGLAIFSKRTTTRLFPGDVDYDAAMDMAKRAGIRIRRVIVQKTAKSTNASARLDGTITLTQGARDKLSDEERRCIIAHEVGHVKGRHVLWLVMFGLVVWGGVFAFSILGGKVKCS